MDLKRSYYEDVRLFTSGTRTFWFACLALLLLVVPWVTPSYYLGDISYMVINVLVAIGLNILVGFTGQVSLGHAGFFAIGAYATVLLKQSWGVLPLPVALVAAGLLAAAFGFLLGLPSLRLEGPYLAIASLGFGMAVTQVLGRFSLFGGRNGLMAPDIDFMKSALAGTGFFTRAEAGAIQLYWLVVPVTFIMAVAARSVMKTRVGRAFIAIRDDDIAAAAMGVHVTRYKTLAFAVSAFYAGVAGGLYAFWLGYINPESFDFLLSVLFLSMVLVGGVGTIPGPVLGGIAISFLNLNLTQDAILRLPLVGPLIGTITKLWMNENGVASVSYIIFGMILILLVVFEPLGLFGFWIRIKKYWKTWPF